MSSRTKSLYGRNAQRAGRLYSMLAPGRAVLAGYARMAANKAKAQARLAATKARKAALATINPRVSHCRTRGDYVPPTGGREKPLFRMLEVLQVPTLSKIGGSTTLTLQSPDNVLKYLTETDCINGLAAAVLIDSSQLENMGSYYNLYQEARLRRTSISITFPWKGGQTPFPTPVGTYTSLPGGFFTPQIYMYVSPLESDFQTFQTKVYNFWTTPTPATAQAVEAWFESQSSYQTRVAQGTVTFDFPHSIALATALPAGVTAASNPAPPGPVTYIADEFNDFNPTATRYHAPYCFFWVTQCLSSSIIPSAGLPPNTPQYPLPPIRMTMKTSVDFRHST